jgi:hypothetical protein
MDIVHELRIILVENVFLILGKYKQIIDEGLFIRRNTERGREIGKVVVKIRVIITNNNIINII